MNKEQFRKELEDCWDAGWVAAGRYQETDLSKIAKQNYITTRLAALDDGDGMDSRKVLQNTLNGAWEEIRRLRALLETDSTGNELLRSIYQICERKGNDTNWEAITKKVQERLEVQSKPLDDGQEGKGLHWAIKLRWLLLEPGTHENNAFVRDVTGELEIRFPNVNIQIGAALPVADGEGEKVGNAGMFKITFTDCWEIDKRIDANQRWMAVNDRLKIVVTAPTKEQAFEEVMISIKVMCAYESKYQLPPALPVADGEWDKAGSLIEFVTNIRDHQCLDGEDIPDPLRLQAKELLESLPSAVTGGVKDDWSEKLYKQLHHIFHQYSDEWTSYQERETEDLLNAYEKYLSEGQPAQGRGESK